MSKLLLKDVPGGAYNIVGLQWYNGCNGYEEGDTYCLCIALDVGRSVASAIVYKKIELIIE